MVLRSTINSLHVVKLSTVKKQCCISQLFKMLGRSNNIVRTPKTSLYLYSWFSRDVIKL